MLSTTEDLEFGSAHATPAEWMLSHRALTRLTFLLLTRDLGAKISFGRAGSTTGRAWPSSRSTVPAVIVWGMSVTEAEALRFLQSGAKGIVRKSADTWDGFGLPAGGFTRQKLDAGLCVPGIVDRWKPKFGPI